MHPPDAGGLRPAGGGAGRRGAPNWPPGGPSTSQRVRRPLPPYPEAEWAAADRRPAGRSSTSPIAAHREALAAAARGSDTRGRAGGAGTTCAWLLARLGPGRAAAVRAHLGLLGSRRSASAAGSSTPAADLFPHLDVVIAYRLLFGVYSGIVPDGIEDLVTGDIDWAGDSTILLSYVKGRTAAESLNLPRRAVRLLEQWLAHSALLRSLVPTRTTATAVAGHQPGRRHRRWSRGPVDPDAIQRWVAAPRRDRRRRRPLKIHRARIRTTHQSMRDKRRLGRAAAGRRSTRTTAPQVEGDHYLTATTPAQRHAVEAIIEDAQHDLLRTRPPARGDHRGRTPPPWPGTTRSWSRPSAWTTRRSPSWSAGPRDVFTAACADQLSGLHGPKGKPCPARPWVCLLCPLAVFAPRHAPNLLRLKAFFSRQWRQMPAAQFMAVFGPYSQRISQVLDRFDPAVAGRRPPTPSPTPTTRLPLRPEETTR